MKDAAEELELLRCVCSLAAETESAEEALKACVEGVCDVGGFSVGHALVPSHDGASLVSSGVWHVEDVALRAAVDNDAFARENRDEGLVGRVWRSGEPQWALAGELAVNGSTPVRGGFAFPVKLRGGIVAICEFYAAHARPASDELRDLVAILAEQVGRVFERRLARESLSRLKHDLRNPLSAIRNGLGVSRARRQAGDADDESRRWLEEMIDRQTDEIRRILDDSSEEEGNAEAAASSRAPNDTSLRILLVEDHEELGAITVELLRKAGHEVRLAVTGQQAVALVSEAPVDLVLCDLNLPDMTGIEAVRRIRELSQRAPLCVALSAHDLDSFDGVADAVFDHYAAKPLDWPALSSTLTRRTR